MIQPFHPEAPETAPRLDHPAADAAQPGSVDAPGAAVEGDSQYGEPLVRLDEKLIIYLDRIEVEGEERHPTPHQHAVLTRLAKKVGQVVSRDELGDMLWGDKKPREPKNALQAHVSGARKILGPELRLGIETRDNIGYIMLRSLLDPEPASDKKGVAGS